MPRQFSLSGTPAKASDEPPSQDQPPPATEEGCLLIYDTETTGLPLFSEPSENHNQPHIVQLAAVLVELPSRKVVSAIDLIVQPDEWVIPDEVADIHGITTEYAKKFGVSESLVVEALCQLWELANFRVAHNEPFDARIVRIALSRFGNVVPVDRDEWSNGLAECTQRMATPLLQLPPTAKMVKAGRKHHKSANLGEAFKHFTGQELVGAHSAMIDVLACMEVYFAIKDGRTGQPS